jgi:hypothetical protein
LGADRGGVLSKTGIADRGAARDQRGIETLGDNIPPPSGPRIEFVFREIGGFIWLQITLIVVVLRILLSGIATAWRSMRRRDAAP